VIYKLDIKDPTKTPVSWLPKIAAFKEPRVLVFKPGLNILWGRNGAGKTSITKVLARLFHCEQGSQPVVTKESLSELTAAGGYGSETIKLEEGIEVKHDGQGVRHFDPGHAVGLTAGGAAFDWDFGDEGFENVMVKGSAGQTTMRRFDRILNEIITGEVPEVQWRMKREHVNSLWQERIDLAACFLKKNSKKGQPTILLDEPERSYDLEAQVGMWRVLRSYAAEVQFIVSSHSLFALNIPEAAYIELSPGYKAIAEKALALLQTWPTDKRPKLPEKVVEQARQNLEARKKR
jgi:predicted ATPase